GPDLRRGGAPASVDSKIVGPEMLTIRGVAVQRAFRARVGLAHGYDNGLMKTSPGVSGGVIAVGRSDNQLVAYSLRDGTEQFRYDVGEPIWGSPAMAGIEIFAASFRALHVVDFNGNLLHKAALSGSTNSSSPAVSLDRVFVSADQGLGSYAWDLSTEIVHTEYRGGVSSPAIMSLGFVVLVTRDGYLRALTPR